MGARRTRLSSLDWAVSPMSAPADLSGILPTWSQVDGGANDSAGRAAATHPCASASVVRLQRGRSS
jgi:hypothetical protein